MQGAVSNPTVRTLPEIGARVGPWEVVRQVGRGGMAVVYEVRNEDGRVGALKLVQPRGGSRSEAEERFRREQRSLARLNHPNIVRVLDTGRWEETDWFVMELVSGRDLRAEVDLWETEPPTNRWAAVRRISADLARALEAVHGAGLVHRDLTPGNVMLADDGRAVLMDFGVAKESAGADDDELTSHGELLGTVAWMSPEQISGSTVDARTDLYSLGALVFLLLTGRRPFHARTIAGYLDKHLHRPVRPPRELNPAIPAELDELCVRLLQKEPARRYASAHHVLVALDEAPRASANLARWPEALVGRLAERGTILGSVAACLDGHGNTVVIEGSPGLGRSTLARFACEEAQAAALPVHVIAGGGAGNALDAFRPLIEALIAGVPHPPEVLRALLGAFGDGAVVERFAVFSAVRALLADSPPRLIVIDDVHRLDATSLEFLEYLIRATRSLADESILFLMTRAADAATAGGLVTGTATGVRPHVLSVGPLALQAVEELLGDLVGSGPAARALARRLHRDSEGNPAFIVEMVRGLAEERVLSWTEADGWRLLLDEPAVNRVPLPIPRSARDALLTQLSRQSALALTVLRVLSLARQELSLEAVSLVVGGSQSELVGAVEELGAAGLVRERRVETTTHLDVAHGRFRDVIGREIGNDERVDLHRRLGDTLERLGRGRIHLVLDAVALHFEAGEMPGKAYSYLLRAGARLLGRSFTQEALAAFDRAVALEHEARELMPLDDADRLLCDLLLKRAEALEALSEWARLDLDLARAIGLADELGDDGLGARARAALGRRARKLGDLVLAGEHFHAALALAERANDQTTRGFVLNQLGTVLWSCGDLEAARRHWVEGLAVAEGAGDERSIGYGYNGLGMVAACRGQAAEARRNFEQAAAVFERLGLAAPLVFARGNLIEVHVCTGNLRRGIELAEKTLAHAREVNQPAGIVLARAAYADVLTHLGRTGEAVVEAMSALTMARELADPTLVLSVLIPLTRASWAKGGDPATASLVDEALALAQEVDHEGWTGIVHAWKARVHALAGDTAAARVQVAAARDTPGPRWPYQEVRLDLALSRVYALLDDRAEAARHADSAIRRADACGYRLYVLKGHILAATLSTDEAAVARHSRIGDALARALAANLSPADAERFLGAEWLRS